MDIVRSASKPHADLVGGLVVSWLIGGAGVFVGLVAVLRNRVSVMF